MKIKWAPVHIPPRRRIQTLAAGLYVTIIFLLPLASLFLTGFLFFFGNYIWKALVVIYIAYIYYDQTRNHSVLSGNGCKWMRSNYFTNRLRDYFPVELIKTAELTPDRNYIVASFPHGIIGTGVSLNMGNNIDKWLQLFPGIRPKIATLDQNFSVPILREVLRLWGCVSVAKESLLFHLRKSNNPNHPENHDGFTSNAVAILVGGAQEALDSHPGRYIITLKRRKGFVKLAIRTGSPIVPSISFGEVDIFDQVNNPPDSWLRRFQSLTKKLTGVSPIILMGRGFFQYTYGFLPRRKHIVQVLGAPIEVKENDEPDPAYVDEIHQKVMDALVDLFETHKTKYIKNAKSKNLVIV